MLSLTRYRYTRSFQAGQEGDAFPSGPVRSLLPQFLPQYTVVLLVLLSRGISIACSFLTYGEGFQASVLTFVPLFGNFALNSTYGCTLLSVPGHVCCGASCS